MSFSCDTKFLQHVCQKSKMLLFRERERDLRPRGAVLGRSWVYVAALGHSWGLCWRSGITLGAYVGGLWPLLGPRLAVLGRSGPKLAVLGCFRSLSGEEGGLGRGSGRKAERPRSPPRPVDRSPRWKFISWFHTKWLLPWKLSSLCRNNLFITIEVSHRFFNIILSCFIHVFAHQSRCLSSLLNLTLPCL